jgi:hypothetical protein
MLFREIQTEKGHEKPNPFEAWKFTPEFKSSISAPVFIKTSWSRDIIVNFVLV